ncbi:MAG: hypothetical protein AB8B85_17020 [Paracoccaceae bacterium]
MAHTLESLAAGIRVLLKDQPIEACADKICDLLSGYLTDPGFSATHLADRAPGVHPREVLFEDPELGFCICGHVYGDAAETGPHDHGPSWAIYGQAEGETVMTDWQITTPAAGGDPALVAPTKVYTLAPGDAHFYRPGAVHSPKRVAPTRLLRIEGANLDNVTRSPIRAA